MMVHTAQHGFNSPFHQPKMPVGKKLLEKYKIALSPFDNAI